MKFIDLTIPLGIATPPWPTYEPLQVKYFKRLAPNGANGQVVTHSNHLGTHLDGEIHFHTPGKDIASLDMDYLVHEAAVVDLSDVCGDYDVYTSKMVEERVEVHRRRYPHHPHRLPSFWLGYAHRQRSALHGHAPRTRPRVRRLGQGQEAALDRRGLRQRRPPDEHHHPRLDAAPGAPGGEGVQEEIRHAAGGVLR